MAKSGLHPGLAFAWAAIFLETIGALCIIFGLFTRFFAAALAIAMIASFFGGIVAILGGVVTASLGTLAADGRATIRPANRGSGNASEGPVDRALRRLRPVRQREDADDEGERLELENICHRRAPHYKRR